MCRTTWRVRRDQTLSDSYVLAARSVPAGLAETQVRATCALTAVSRSAIHPRSGVRH